MLESTWQVIRSGAVIASLSALVAGCYDSNKQQTKEGQSHWLERCASSADCSADEICACGVCTIACADSATCGERASCEPVAERAACGDAPPSARSVCLQACSLDMPCDAPGLSCREGACVTRAPIAVEPSDGDPALIPTEDAGSVQSEVDDTNEPAMPSGTGGDLRDGEGSCDEVDGCDSAGELAMTLLWMPQPLEYLEPRFPPSGLCPEGSNVEYGGQVSQPIEIEVSLPAFVDISGLPPPPPEALVALDMGRSGGWTTGHLVLYRDNNGNGLLDPRNLEQDSPDEILGTSGDWGLQFGPTPNTTSYVIYYSDERLPEYGPTIEQGYNVFRDMSDGGGQRVPVPLDTPIPVPEREHPKVQTMNCEELCFARDEEFTCPATLDALPDGGSFDCYPSSAFWSRQRCDGCFCYTATCTYDGQSCPGD